MPIPQVKTYGTLTNQQQQLMDQLQGNITAGGKPVAIDPGATANYVNQAVAAPLLQQYDQQIMPRLKDSFAAVGALMGSRRGFASQQALGNLQTTIGSEMGKAQLANQQLSAQLALQYNQLGAGLVGQSHMALQPYINNQQPYAAAGSGYGGGFGGFGGVNPFGGPGVDNSHAISPYSAQIQNPQAPQPVTANAFSDFLDQMLKDPKSQNFSPTKQGDFPWFEYDQFAPNLNSYA